MDIHMNNYSLFNHVLFAIVKKEQKNLHESTKAFTLQFHPPPIRAPQRALI